MILTLVKKDLLDTGRDRRTIITNILAPMLLFPVLIFVITTVGSAQMKEAQERVLDVAMITQGNAELFRDMILAKGDLLMAEGEFRIREDLNLSQSRAMIVADSLDAAIYFDPDFDRLVAAGLPGRVSFYFKETDQGREERKRLSTLLDKYRDLVYEQRIRGLGLDPRLALHPVEINRFNLASDKERFAFVVAAVVPYIFILFSLIGCIHPATDLSAGEKERGTLETLLTIPASRGQILIAKFLVVFLSGLCSAAISMTGLYVGFRFLAEGSSDIHKAIAALVEPQVVIMVLFLLLPVTILFAAISLTLGIYAKSYKEAQSMLGPVMMSVFVPLYIGVIPGLRLSYATAAVPILNVSLSIKAIVAGTADPLALVIVYLSLMLTAGTALFVCSRMFRRESAVFRT
ncbi:MAG: ABC transporter permease subunit [Candidatus Latescibacteria bacterium]|jgi:sodium transport system permease protein|nr:hypothetical protein [Gemmatimonadaceae bacterium]MDP6016274.1 ABC transporter permease subunit [Candidatus Latescibacterota bacterium]MDP7449749.1 ABC transporter permease subunit [Candidatus Latescibacterota bacterium]